MKFAYAAVAFAGAVVAQDACLTDALGIPACALGYLVSAAADVAQCGIVDFQCQCSHSSEIQATLLDPILTICGASAQSVLKGVQTLCGCASSNAGQTVSLNAVGSACAASAAAIPPCALGYLADAANSIGNCAVDDFACQCSNYTPIQAAIASTLNVQCSTGGGLGEVIDSANALCACVTSVAGGGSGSSPAATTAAGTAPSSSAAAGGSSPVATGSSAKATSAQPTKFTGAAVSAIPAVGGVFGAVIGLLAYL